MLENRLRLARDLLNERGSIFVRCDYNGNWLVRPLMNEIFGEENFRNEIDLKRTRTLKGEGEKFHTSNDTLFFYAKQLIHMLFNGYKRLKEKPEWVRMHLPGTVKGDASRVVLGKKIYPPTGRKWVLDQNGFDRAIKDGLIKWDDELNEPLFLSKYETIGSDWTDISSYSFDWDFPTENSEILLKRVIESTSNEGDLVMDFFLGSGTTTAVAHKLKRKWIGVEMGEHFWTVVLPRMKKVLAYDKSGISKEKDVKEKYNEKTAGGFFKYQILEQYEDTLDNIELRENQARRN
jgi:adenine-specific DNA-methyltransferase